MAPMTDLAVTEVGGGAQPLVFVHGVLDRGRAFAKVAEQLAGECRMWWYDRRGYGASADAAGTPQPLPGHVDDLVAIIDELPVDGPVVLAAHSFGGVIALSTALRRPDRVAALALYETGMAWLPGWPVDGINELFFREDAETAAVEAIFGSQLDRLEPEARAWRQREGRAFVAEQLTVRTPGFAEPDLASLQAPVVYGHGDAEQPWALVVEHLRQRVRHLEVVRVPGAAHDGHRSHPVEVAGLVRRAVVLATPRR